VSNHLTLDDAAKEFDLPADEIEEVIRTYGLPFYNMGGKVCRGLLEPALEAHRKEQDAVIH
jgi:hypothetical protein